MPSCFWDERFYQGEQLWLEGKKKRNRVRAISPLESSLSEKRMKWEKGTNMPRGCQKDKREHQSLANKKQTMARSQTASFGQSCLWTGLESNGHKGPTLTCAGAWGFVQPCSAPPWANPAPLDTKQAANKSQALCLQSCHSFRLP